MRLAQLAEHAATLERLCPPLAAEHRTRWKSLEARAEHVDPLAADEAARDFERALDEAIELAIQAQTQAAWTVETERLMADVVAFSDNLPDEVIQELESILAGAADARLNVGLPPALELLKQLEARLTEIETEDGSPGESPSIEDLAVHRLVHLGVGVNEMLRAALDESGDRVNECFRWDGLKSGDLSYSVLDYYHQERREIEDLLAIRTPEDLARLDAVEARLRASESLAPVELRECLSVLRKLRAEDALARAAAGCPMLDRMPRQQFWRLVIDWFMQEVFGERAEFSFENEQGYLAAMLGALALVLETLDEPLTPELYVALHDASIDQVEYRGGTVVPFHRGFRDGSNVRFGLVTSEWGNATVEGLAELAAHFAAETAGEPNPWYELRTDDEEKLTRLFCHPRTADQCRARCQQILDRYGAAITRADGEESRLRAILRVCQDLERSHLFPDANGRTVSFLVLNKLLLQQGLSPVILKNPAIFDATPEHEALAAIRQGQTMFLAMAGNASG